MVSRYKNTDLIYGSKWGGCQESLSNTHANVFFFHGPDQRVGVYLAKKYSLYTLHHRSLLFLCTNIYIYKFYVTRENVSASSPILSCIYHEM